ncbi:MAG TPA: choice-of-anchor D domain-containing protein [Actinomycetota bacterium]|nr:choice-of-anchor D domain-containing protein [Actinomycetota bacterium]
MPQRPHRFTRFKSIAVLVSVSLVAAQGLLLAAAETAHGATANTTAGTITEFRPAGISQTATSDPLGITTGPDGNLWFVDAGASTIGFMTPDGTSVHEHATNTPNATPVAITSGPDSRLWFTELSGSVNQVGRQTAAIPGIQNEFGINKANALPTGIVTGPDGNMWFTDFGNATIGRINPNAAVGSQATTFPITNPGLAPMAITSGPNGHLWFTEQGGTAPGGKIGEMTTAGTMVSDTQATSGASAGIAGITVGPDGNLWFTEQSAGIIGMMTPQHVVHEFPRIAGTPAPSAITAGSDGALWFIDQGNNAIGRITTGGTVSEFPVPTHNAFSPRVQPTGITSGPNGNIYFTENDQAAAIGEVSVGVGGAGQVQASPTSINFGSQTVGSSSSPQTITLSNGTTSTVTLNPVTLGGTNPGEFALATDGCSGATLPGGQSCSVSVSFAPNTTGTFSGSVGFSEAGGGSQSVALSGTGASPSGGGGGGGGCSGGLLGGLLSLIQNLLHALGLGSGC